MSFAQGFLSKRFCNAVKVLMWIQNGTLAYLHTWENNVFSRETL